MDPRKISTRTEKLSGFEAVSNMISQGGEPLMGVVKNKFPHAGILSEIQT